MIVMCDAVLKLYVLYRFRTGTSGCIVVWGSSQNLCISYSTKVELPDDGLQHNGMTNSETEMCM